MPFELDLPPSLRRQGWKLKIRERERLEPPHVTIIRRTSSWRYDLRDARFLDRDSTPREVPGVVIALIDLHLDELRAAWDEMYPENPIGDLS